jgi:uncharacterized protein YndB with AHSA1/START domain
MGHDFEIHHDAEFDATPEQIWDAIATGPGIDSWYMGRTQIEVGEGGAVRTIFGDHILDSTVTRWNPAKQLAYRGQASADGRLLAFEFLIEGRDNGSTLLRMVASGFLPGDDWEAEYDAMTTGLGMYIRTLATYLKYFPGRTATPICVFGPPVTDRSRTWSTLLNGLGLSNTVTEGDSIGVTIDGLTPIQGVVEYITPVGLGLRADNALYRFMQGFRGGLVIAHLMFSDINPQAAERAWHAWLRAVE